MGRVVSMDRAFSQMRRAKMVPKTCKIQRRREFSLVSVVMIAIAILLAAVGTGIV